MWNLRSSSATSVLGEFRPDSEGSRNRETEEGCIDGETAKGEYTPVMLSTPGFNSTSTLERISERQNIGATKCRSGGSIRTFLQLRDTAYETSCN